MPRHRLTDYQSVPVPPPHLEARRANDLWRECEEFLGHSFDLDTFASYLRVTYHFDVTRDILRTIVNDNMAISLRPIRERAQEERPQDPLTYAKSLLKDHVKLLVHHRATKEYKPHDGAHVPKKLKLTNIRFDESNARCWGFVRFSDDLVVDFSGDARNVPRLSVERTSYVHRALAARPLTERYVKWLENHDSMPAQTPHAPSPSPLMYTYASTTRIVPMDFEETDAPDDGEAPRPEPMPRDDALTLEHLRRAEDTLRRSQDALLESAYHEFVRFDGGVAEYRRERHV